MCIFFFTPEVYQPTVQQLWGFTVAIKDAERTIKRALLLWALSNFLIVRHSPYYTTMYRKQPSSILSKLRSLDTCDAMMWNLA